MNNPAQREGDDNWSCSNCGTPQLVASGSRYHRCDACGALFKLAWRSGRLDVNAIRPLLPDAVDLQFDPDLLKQNIIDQRGQLREMSMQIRMLEMSKGSERLGLLAIFVIICAAIFTLFQITVVGWESLLDPGVVELGVAAAVVVSMLILLVLRMIRAATVRKVQLLQHNHDELERRVESTEATLALRGYDVGEKPVLEEPEDPDENPSDIIEKFASRQKERRSRLGLRNRSEEEN